ncbi:MAG: hypothetical protein KDA68_10660 [Planctomycetaceae bacterium]|nr:hypothetical protein [Planctomycetaceae bacterium]
MPRRRRSSYHYEPLEDRTLLSVSALFSPASGKLTIKGDCDGQAVLVEGTGDEGSLDVYYGGAHLGNFTGVKHIQAKFGSGADTLHLSAVEIPGNLKVNMGAGEDTLVMKNTPLSGPSPDGDLLIRGNTTVKMGNNAGDYVLMNADSGTYGIYLRGNAKFLGSADVDLRGAGGSASIELPDVNVAGNLMIKLSQFGDANGDNENLRLRDVNVFGTTKILGSTSADKMEIYRSRFADRLDINTRAGDDLIDTQIGGASSHFEGPVKVNGGAGDDTYDQSLFNVFASTETIFSIETLN